MNLTTRLLADLVLAGAIYGFARAYLGRPPGHLFWAIVILTSTAGLGCALRLGRAADVLPLALHLAVATVLWRRALARP